jgi:hypothetical protein
MLAARDEIQTCGIGNACVTTTMPLEAGARGRASGLLASGATLGAVGIGMAVAGAVGKTPAIGARKSERRLVMGTWLAGFGAGAAAYGLGFAAGAGSDGRAGQFQDRAEGRTGAIAVGVVGGGMLLVGAPLAISAAGSDPAQGGRKELRSEGRMYAGMAMSTVGVASFAAGTVVMTTVGDQGGEFSGLAAMLMGAPPVLGGLALLAVGLPLWATGASERTPGAPVEEASVRVGPGSVALEGSF